MFLTARTIRRLILDHNPPLIDVVGGTDAQIDDLVKRVQRLEGSVFEFTLESIEVQRKSRDIPFLGKDDRMIPPAGTLSFAPLCEVGTPETWLLRPGISYKLVSLETVTMPLFLCAFLDPRTSEFKAQGDLSMARIAPGFKGTLTGEFHITAEDGFIKMQRGFKFCQASFGLFISDEVFGMFEKIFRQITPDEVDDYQGIWGEHTGNQTTTDGKTVRAF